jgi:lysophospholipase L1-like esterase
LATKKKIATKRDPARTDVNLRAAMAGGQSAAEEVIEFRMKQRRKRAAIEKKLAASPRGLDAHARVRVLDTAAFMPETSRALFGARTSVGVLIAEGDSWFDYPMQDVLRLLEDKYLFDVESVAHMGDCVEDMAHSKGQFEEFARRLEKLLGQTKVPRAILLSGGGNDIAGDEFAILLNHATSKLPPLNEDILRGVIDVRLKQAYASILSSLTVIARSYLGRPIPIITHGYDYPVPDGRGFAGGWWKLPGPWLKPAFQKKGHDDLTKNTQVIVQLIDRFNAMLRAVSALPEFAHVHYLDLRGTLNHDGTYKKHWANELHPNATGFDLVTKKFADALNKV